MSEKEKMANRDILIRAADFIIRNYEKEKTLEENDDGDVGNESPAEKKLSPETELFQEIKSELSKFNDLFQEDEIIKDAKDLIKIILKIHEETNRLSSEEKRKRMETKKISEAMEIMIIKSGEQYRWWGKDACVTRTTKFDDIKNSVDAVLEFNEDKNTKNKKMALVIDVTSASDIAVLDNKITKNISAITGEKPRGVKYFHSEITGENQTLPLIIPVVIGLDADHSHDLLKEFAAMERLNSAPGKNENDRETLKQKKTEWRSHPAQMIFLKEITHQLEHYLRLNIKKETKKEINELIKFIDQIIHDKKHLNDEELQEDLCYKKIKKLMS